MSRNEKEEPKPSVQLTGTDGNAFALMSKVAKALEQAGCSPSHVNRYHTESMQGDYSNLLRVASEFANIS